MNNKVVGKSVCTRFVAIRLNQYLRITNIYAYIYKSKHTRPINIPAEESFAGVAADSAEVETATLVAANAAAFPHAVHPVLDPGGPRVQPPGSRVGPDRLDDLRGLRGDGGRDSDGGRRVMMARKDDPLGQVWPIHRIQ